MFSRHLMRMGAVEGQKDRSARRPSRNRELALKSGPDVFAAHYSIALYTDNDAIRIAACRGILDRAYGRSPQPHTGEEVGVVVVNVITGVPRR